MEMELTHTLEANAAEEIVIAVRANVLAQNQRKSHALIAVDREKLKRNPIARPLT